jgi:hypothetical protein
MSRQDLECAKTLDISRPNTVTTLQQLRKDVLELTAIDPQKARLLFQVQPARGWSRRAIVCGNLVTP